MALISRECYHANTKYIIVNASTVCTLKKSKRGTCICAHAWIFFKLCILMTHYIQTMKMHLSNWIVKNKAYEATLTYSTLEVVPASEFLCPKSKVLFISMICHLDWLQDTIGIILIPRNHLDKLWFYVF